MQRTLFFILCWLPLVLADDSWENFTNNLATDLAPLITLFGERLTKQFLSESISLLDNVIFALSPLGVLTAVVSLIRVCGGSSLRAFIGRAQEGPAEAESELLPCVSESTAELFNDGGISRVFGRPKVLEIIAWEDTNTKTGETFIEIGTLRDALMRGAWKNTNDGARSPFPVEGFPELDIPNLSLNKGIKRRDQFWFYCAAVIGTVLQIGDIVYAAITVFVFPENFKKNGQLVPSYALPFYIIGTSFMFVGMFYSAVIIERSSEEYIFEPKLPSKIYWLQPGNQNVGDQVFNSFLAVKEGPGYSKKAKMRYIKSKRVRKYDERHAEIYSTVMFTISGFIIQFIGLRGLHASVILAQLGSTFVMSIIRTCLRTERMAPGENKMSGERKLVSHKKQELDCFAFHLERVASFGLINSPSPESSSDDSSFDSLAKLGRSLVEQLIYTRTRLAELTSTPQSGGNLAWDNLPIRIIAQRLAEAINSTMELLSSWDIEFKQGFQFDLMFECTPASSELERPLQGSYTVEVERSGDVLKWRVNAKELEAIIGLWTWSLYKSDVDWLGRRSSLPFSRVIGLSESEAGQEKTYLYFHKWIFRKTEPTMTTAKSFDIPRRLFGRDIQTEPNGRGILIVDTQNELEVMIAQDIYIQFLRFAVGHLDDLGHDVDVIPGPQNSFVAQNGRINELVHCFESCNLGSREDALLCIIPMLKACRLLPVLSAECPQIRKRTEDLIKKNDWKKALQLVEWISQRTEGDEMEHSIHEMGYLCRKALLASDSTAHETGLVYLRKILGQDMRHEFLRSQMRSAPSTWSAPPDYQLRWQSLQRELGWVAWHISNNVPGINSLRACLNDFHIDNALDQPGIMGQNASDPAVGSRVVEKWLTFDHTDFLCDLIGNDVIQAYHWALTRGCFALLYFFLARWVDLGTEFPDIIQQAYAVAAKNRHDWGVKVLLRRQTDINSTNANKDSALLELIAEGDLEAVRILLANGANPNGEDHLPNKRPLLFAAQLGMTHIVELLLKYGAGLEAVDSFGMSALHWACNQKQFDTVHLLASHGANLNIDATEKKPLHTSVLENNFQMVQLLLELGADINAPDSDSGRTALMYATTSSHTAILQLLLAKGADIHARDEEGRTALDWAKRNGCADGAATLEALSDTQQT